MFAQKMYDCVCFPDNGHCRMAKQQQQYADLTRFRNARHFFGSSKRWYLRKQACFVNVRASFVLRQGMIRASRKHIYVSVGVNRYHGELDRTVVGHLTRRARHDNQLCAVRVCDGRGKKRAPDNHTGHQQRVSLRWSKSTDYQ